MGTTEATIRNKSTGVREVVTCNEKPKARFEGRMEPLAPAGVRKGTSARASSETEFDAGSGELSLVEEFGGNKLGTEKTIGSLKILGYESQELIQVK